MKIITSFLIFFTALNVWAVTPELGTLTYEAFDLDCPSGQSCVTLPHTFCSQNNVEISPNDDGSFDIVFNSFNVITNSSANYASASCLLDIPIMLPPNQQVALKEVSIAGVTVVSTSGRSTASITHFIGGRESTRTEAFVDTESFVVTHAQELSDQYSKCGDGETTVSTRVDVTASRSASESANTYINLSSGSGKLQYRFDYQECTPEPDTCSSDQFELDGVCYDIGSQCSDYHGTNSTVCNTTYDSLSCDWDVKRSQCYSSCLPNQFKYNGNCYDIATSCSEYDSTHTNVCNNGFDNLQCDWTASTQTCVNDCSSSSTFELDGQCYQKNGSCSQYNSTNTNTCNTGLDNLPCDWIPIAYSDSSLAGTCVSNCPGDAFALDGQCFQYNGNCSQYNGTDTETCNNQTDHMGCDWIPVTYGDFRLAGTCVSNCPADAFKIDGQCYQYNGSCSQYNGTDTETCNNGTDNMMCDWIPGTYGDSSLANTCVSTCPSGAFPIDGQCYQFNGSCSQYNGTNTETCNNGTDNMVCDWIPGTYGDSSLANTCVSTCPSGSFPIDGQCYQRNGSCSQYNGTNSETCNNTQDNLLCDWNSNSQVCYPE